MDRAIRRFVRDERGQGMTEYIIIVCLIAIAAIFVVRMFGTQIKRAFIFMTNRIAGDDAATYDGSAQAQADGDNATVDFDAIK